MCATIPWPNERRPTAQLIDTTAIAGELSTLGQLEFQLVRRTGDEPLFNSLLEQHHYLHYEQPVGAQLKYLIWAQSRPIACLACSSAPRHLGARDRYIGWSAEARRRNVRFLAYNTRFLILPWVRVKNLASHILGRMALRISQDWEDRYGHPLYFLETFVDPERFRGTCYYAANWVWLGETTGRGVEPAADGPAGEEEARPLRLRSRQARAAADRGHASADRGRRRKSRRHARRAR